VAGFLLVGGAAAAYVYIQTAELRGECGLAARPPQTELAIILVWFSRDPRASLLVYRRVARPIERLSEAVRSGALTSRGQRAVAGSSGPAEVTALAEDIGRLMASIRTSWRQRQRAETRTSGARGRSCVLGRRDPR
jgi:hypothetical protein